MILTERWNESGGSLQLSVASISRRLAVVCAGNYSQEWVDYGSRAENESYNAIVPMVEFPPLDTAAVAQAQVENRSSWEIIAPVMKELAGNADTAEEKRLMYDELVEVLARAKARVAKRKAPEGDVVSCCTNVMTKRKTHGTNY